ncbi:unnamed protein product [Cyprideis torosa]|uniref:Uncharacterized protein n=1 Tax=Cyprideis torosa TaxID=163714 RepID=A0A7R8W3M1_9CRUS|nr:unnamed protein product [Cyprideis torosa]CAG0881011.1 unnamed protein product [Cyprideis torosa]
MLLTPTPTSTLEPSTEKGAKLEGPLDGVRPRKRLERFPSNLAITCTSFSPVHVSSPPPIIPEARPITGCLPAEGAGGGRWILGAPAALAAMLVGHGGNKNAKMLYDDLLSDYNRLIRPVANVSQTLTVRLGLKLSQLIEVNLKNQIMTTNLWVVQNWTDYKLRWDPMDYGGVDTLYVPSEHIWLPDIVLFNNADGNYEVTQMTKATINYNGEVVWTPPAIYKSSCQMNVEWFPFDEQSCLMKFASWTYDGHGVDLKHIDQKPGNNINVVPVGIDLAEFYLSVEWDILEVPARRNQEYYPCCPGVPFPASNSTALPPSSHSPSSEKVSLCISVLVSLTVFFLLLAEIIPPTSLAVPLLGKYLLFTMVLVTVSIYITVCVLNVHFRRPATHKMSPWVKKVFVEFMPSVLMMRRPEQNSDGKPMQLEDDLKLLGYGYNDLEYRDHFGRPSGSTIVTTTENFNNPHQSIREEIYTGQSSSPDYARHRQYSAEVLRAIEAVQFIAQHIKDEDEDQSVQEDWKYVATVLDRLFLWIFIASCTFGTIAIMLRAPSLYDTRHPIDVQLSKVGRGFAFRTS